MQQNVSVGAIRQTYAPGDSGDWYVADGRALQTFGYPELFALIGYTYGGQDSGPFNLPTIAESNGLYSLMLVR